MNTDTIGGILAGFGLGYLVCLLVACENPIDHFTEPPHKQREYIIGPECLQTIDSITVDDTGRETTYHSCTVGEP